VRKTKVTVACFMQDELNDADVSARIPILCSVILFLIRTNSQNSR
jgi:hypothetical protein